MGAATAMTSLRLLWEHVALAGVGGEESRSAGWSQFWRSSGSCDGPRADSRLFRYVSLLVVACDWRYLSPLPNPVIGNVPQDRCRLTACPHPLGHTSRHPPRTGRILSLSLGSASCGTCKSVPEDAYQGCDC